MTTILDEISIKNIHSITNLDAKFIFPPSKILVITGKNGAGKTSIVKAFHLLKDPKIFEKSSALNSIKEGSKITFNLMDFNKFSFKAKKIRGKIVLDTRDYLPDIGAIIAELPIPFGDRFSQFSLIANFDSEIRTRIASSEYSPAIEIIDFLSRIYSTEKFNELKAIRIQKHTFYFLLKPGDYYVREDHLSSGEFFLIQLYRLITSGANLVLVDELDVALDAAAQVKIYNAIKPILEKYNTRLIVISHSLAFMNTADEDGLYYLEESNGLTSLEQRSLGYIKSDLYGFIGKDRYIITEDKTLAGFLKYLIDTYIENFFEYEIIPVGGEPQIKAIVEKNDSDGIFGAFDHVIAVVDRDIKISIEQNWKSKSKLYSSPVTDIELYIWNNRDRLLPDIKLEEFTLAKTHKKSAKTYWKKIINSGQKSQNELYALIIGDFQTNINELKQALTEHLCLNDKKY